MATNPFETRNPFAVTAPGAPSMESVSAPQKADVTNATAQGYEAATATNERAQATLRTVQDNELVQNQLAKIIGDDSPLIQRARQKALEGMNARGLVNSSMAMGAADAAMYDTALPIAQADAQTFGSVARDNQAVQNSMAQFNAGETNQTNRTNAGLINEASRFTADAGNRVSLANADAANRASLQTNDQQFKASTFNADATNRARMQENDQQFRAALANSDAQTRAALTVLDSELAQQRQSAPMASEVYRQYQSSVTAILTSDMPDSAKQAAINTLINSTRQAMRFTQAMDLAQIDEILQMPDLGGTTATTGGTTSTTPPGSAPPPPADVGAGEGAGTVPNWMNEAYAGG